MLIETAFLDHFLYTYLKMSTKKPCRDKQGFFYSYEQRGWEKFFTVKQRGICLLVINFTLIIYQTLYILCKCLINVSHFRQNFRIILHIFQYNVVKQVKEESLMKKKTFFLLLTFILIATSIHILALLNLFPLLISAPLLFFSFILFFVTINQRNRFKGF